ncbi:MAG: radical SAM protein [Schwartzia sp. (in: firmicutes)]
MKKSRGLSTCLKKWGNRVMVPLKLLVMSLTGRCNLTCRYCYASGQDAGMMDWETCRRAIDLAATPREAFVLQLSGGEPLLALPLIRKLTAYIREQGILARLQIQTNGTLLTEEAVDFLAAAKFGIGVSLDGRAAENDAMRRYPDGRGAWADTVEGIRRLGRRGIGVGLTTVVTADNVETLADIVDVAYFLGNVKKIGFDLLRGQGRGVGQKAASPEKVAAAMAAVLARAKKLAALTGRQIRFTQVEQAKAIGEGHICGFAHCHAMNGASAHVDARGRFYVCSSFVGEDRFLIGDTQAGLDEERQRETAAFITERMRFCPACPDFSACGGACFARWYGGSREGADLTECALKRAAVRAAGR